MSNIDTINLIIGIYGAILATASMVLAVVLGVIEIRRNQPAIKVRIDTFQLFDNNPRTRNRTPSKYVGINVSNHGTRPVIIESYTFEDNRKHILALPNHLEPSYKLDDGEAHTIKIPATVFTENEEFLNRLRKVRVSDSTGKVWKMKISRKVKKRILEML